MYYSHIYHIQLSASSSEGAFSKQFALPLMWGGGWRRSVRWAEMITELFVLEIMGLFQQSGISMGFDQVDIVVRTKAMIQQIRLAIQVVLQRQRIQNIADHTW